jgi:hypothetical protein
MACGPKPTRTGSLRIPRRAHARAHHFVPRLGRALLLSSLLAAALRLPAQDLAPRAYIITPIHTNAVTLTWGYYNGGLNFGGTIPITGATGSYSVPVISLYHTLSFFGRSANLTASLPYGVGTFEGAVLARKPGSTARVCSTFPSASPSTCWADPPCPRRSSPAGNRRLSSA